MASKGATLDMSRFFGTRKEKIGFCQDLLGLLKSHGCVKLQNHGIPADDIHRLFKKETLDMRSPDDSLVDNLWLPEEGLPGFRSFMESFYSRTFQKNEFRLLHYPAIPASELGDGFATRIAKHTDFGTITMLFQDSVSGLQVEDQNQPGIFHDVESSACTDIILNIGDSLQRLTNDTFKAQRPRILEGLLALDS